MNQSCLIMTRKNYYITTDGVLKRRENTIYFINKDSKRPLPINKIYTIYSYGALSISSQVLNLLSRESIPVHFFNRYGYYTGSFYPRESLISGDLIIKQSEHFLDHEKRIELAKYFVRGAAHNMQRVLDYYKIENGVGEILRSLDNSKSITDVMNVEARIRADYYTMLDMILHDDFKIVKRTRRPPTNMMNSLISFGNSLLYSTIISELYNTQLNPTISYLHEPFERRYSLALDLSEIFKPILVDRLILYMIKKKIIKIGDFERDMNYCLLNDSGRKKFIIEYDKRLSKTIKHKDLGRKVSYRRLIRLDAYKLIKHLIGEKRYEPFRIWW